MFYISTHKNHWDLENGLTMKIENITTLEKVSHSSDTMTSQYDKYGNPVREFCADLSPM